MTYGEILRKYQGITDVKVDDFRPAVDIQVDDLVGKPGIRIWLENGDSVIYFPKKEQKNEKKKHTSSVHKLL